MTTTDRKQKAPLEIKNGKSAGSKEKRGGNSFECFVF
jgi:hypothetical protein